MIGILIVAVNGFARILVLLLIVRAIMSWFVRGSYGNLYNAYQALCNITEPIVAPCRALCSKLNTGMLDISVLLAFFLIEILRTVIVTLLHMFA